MDNLFDSGISIEKMAAFLDGNLSASEMQNITETICGNAELGAFIDVCDNIDHTIDEYMPLEIMPSQDIIDGNFDIPQIPFFEDLLSPSDIFVAEEHSMSSDDQYCKEDMNQQVNTEFGQLTEDDIQQQYPDTCAIKSQQLILESHDINVTENELVEESVRNGWYVPGNGGTSPEDVGNLLEEHGMKVNHFEHATIEDLAAELAKGHHVIVGVDSGELWYNDDESFEDFINGPGADHALIVSGIQLNPLTAEREIILTDPGTGEVAHTYTMEQFQDAWDDSDNFMVTAEY